MGIRDEIIGILTQTQARIRTEMSAKGVNASGRTSASILVTERSDGFALVGGGKNAAPIPTLEIGREGGKVPAGFYKIIKQWTMDKGLTFDSERERGTFAYFVARKIAREGTGRHVKPVDVYSSVVNDAVGKINDVLGKWTGGLIREVMKSTGSVSSIKTNF